MGLEKPESNLNEEGYDLVRYILEYGYLFVYNRETEGYEKWIENDNYAGFTLRHDSFNYEFVCSVPKVVAKGRCDACEILVIQGVICHERGCPQEEEDIV